MEYMEVIWWSNLRGQADRSRFHRPFSTSASSLIFLLNHVSCRRITIPTHSFPSTTYPLPFSDGRLVRRPVLGFERVISEIMPV